jgi:hypothetical protein
LLGDDRDWDGDSAKEQIFEWAGWPDEEDPEKAKAGFFAYDDSEPTQKQSYKLPFAVVVDGDLKAVPRGIQAVAAVLEGSRGGVNLPDSVIAEVRKKVEEYYDEMGDEVPW